jgi:predicted CXXCH cytochrome family protein
MKGGGKMKKIFLVCLISLVTIILAYGMSFAKVGGPCVNCHTMHNSQDGVAMAVNTDGSADNTPNAHLLKGSCFACHMTPGVTGLPKVDKTSSILAGGSFNSTYATTDTMRHNLYGNGAADSQYPSEHVDGILSTAPGGTLAAANLTCAGLNGCHGDGSATGNSAGINGFHHATKGAGSYRLLMVRGRNVTNILGTSVTGKGTNTYEAGGATAGDHNVYSSAAGTSISELCGNCHGQFHGKGTDADVWDAGASAWIRHPTDEDIPGTWVITIDSTFINTTPFGFDDVSTLNTNNTTNYTMANGRVICISCHRAHGSNQADLLRFNYAAQLAGGGAVAGCLGCHTTQR